jgi:hypothetical protein
MLLHDQENGSYASDPRAAYWNNKLYLFGRDPNNSIVVMTYDGTSWSDPATPSGSQTCNAVTPFVSNSNLYAFYPGVGSGNPLCCNQYDENLNVVNWWVASSGSTIYPQSISEIDTTEIAIFFNNGNDTLCDVLFYPNSGFSGGFSSGNDPQNLQLNLSFWPSVTPCLGNNYVATRGNNANLYFSRFDQNVGQLFSPTQLGEISMGTAPCTLLLDSENGVAHVAVFYVSGTKNSVNIAIVEINGGSGGEYPTYKVKAIQDTGVTVSQGNCSPFSIACQ